MLNNIRTVLIGTSHPGNIGSAARAMKTMGLSQLYLVEPLTFPHPKATEMAAGAVDLLEKAIVVNSLDEALHDCSWVVGTSVRERAIPWPMLTPREFAEKTAHSSNNKVAILFGREQSGLTNEELHRCQYHIQIPSNPVYSSLNLAAAVQVIAYELRVAASSASAPVQWDYPLANQSELEGMFAHLEQVLIELDFLKPSAPRQLMTRLRRLFYRAGLDKMEVNILRGIYTAIKQQTSKK